MDDPLPYPLYGWPLLLPSYHVVWAVSVVAALSAEVVEADADAAELLVADAVVPVHLAPPPPLHAPPEGDPRAPARPLRGEGVEPPRQRLQALLLRPALL